RQGEHGVKQRAVPRHELGRYGGEREGLQEDRHGRAQNPRPQYGGDDDHQAHLAESRGDVFFFSSRRRHTRSKRDWSSDVCSSDLDGRQISLTPGVSVAYPRVKELIEGILASGLIYMNSHAVDFRTPALRPYLEKRSEERRVGKECRSRVAAYHRTKTTIRLTRADN